MSLLNSHSIQCPYCLQVIEVTVDCSISRQEYVEDCHVCCRPIVLRIEVDQDQEIYIDASREND